MFASIMGYFLGNAKIKGVNKGFSVFLGLISAIILHGLWNFLAGCSSICFYLYVMMLSVLCAFMIVKMLKDTRYHIIHANLSKQIRKNIKMALKDSYSHNVLSRLRKVNAAIKYLRNIEGEEQDELVRWIQRKLPRPITDFAEEGPNGILNRLDVIHEALLELKQRSDWGVKLLFSLAVILPSTFLLVILALFEVY